MCSLVLHSNADANGEMLNSSEVRPTWEWALPPSDEQRRYQVMVLDSAAFGRCGVARLGELATLGHHHVGRAWKGLPSGGSRCEDVVVHDGRTMGQALKCRSGLVSRLTTWPTERLREALGNRSQKTEGSLDTIVNRLAVLMDPDDAKE